MKKTNPTNKTKGLFGFLTTLALAIGVGISLAPKEVVQTKAAEASLVALTFPDDNSANNKVGSYTDTKTYKKGTYEWSISNFNNNNWNSGWAYIKAGRKNNTSEATISTTTVMAPAITKVAVTVDSFTSGAVSSHTLVVASDSAFTTNVQTITGPTAAAGTLTYNVTNPTENQFYKLTYNMTSASSNGTMQISKVQYIYNETPASELTGISVTGTPVTQYIGQAFNPSGLTFKALYEDLSEETLNTNAVSFNPAIISEDTSEVIISYGGFTTSVEVTVEELVAQVGTYTMSSGTTAYTTDPALTNFTITKTNSLQEDFVLGNKTNLRLGSSPNTGYIMLGTGTASGSFSLTMPTGVYVTALTLNNVVVSDGAMTLNANGGTNVSLTNSSISSLSFNTYTNVITLNASMRIWITSISIQTATIQGAAEHYANLFLDGTAAECLTGSVKTTTWNTLGATYSGMDSAVKAQFSGVLPNAEGSVLEQYIARYTYIGEKYGYSDFMSLGLAQSAPTRTVNKNSDNTNLMTVTVLIGVVGLTTLFGYYFLQRKKVINK